MPASPTPVTVIIVTYNSAVVLGDCLRALPGAMRGIDNWRVVVVDNASRDDSRSIVADIAPDALVVDTGSNTGYAAAINRGVTEAAAIGDAGHLLVMNPDVRLGEGSVRTMLDELAHPKTGIVVPRLTDGAGDLLYSLRRDPSLGRTVGAALLGGNRSGRWSRTGEIVTTPSAYERTHAVDWALGAVLLISADCARAVGRWDESFFLYSEEVDYCQRARQHGFEVRYVPTATAVHLGGDQESSPALHSLLVRNKLRLFQRHHGRSQAANYRGALLLNEGVRLMRGSTTHRAGFRELLRPESRAANAQTIGRRTLPSRPDADGFVFFAAQDYWYHSRAHSDLQLARHIGTSRTILLVNSIGMRMPVPGRSAQPVRRLYNKLKSVARLVRRPVPEAPGFHVMTPFILPFYGVPTLRKLNAALVRWQVLLVQRVIGIQRPQVIVTVPTAWDVVRPMKRRSLLVNRSDKYSAFKESNQDLMLSLEKQLLSQADVSLFVSHWLMEDEAPLVGGTSVYLGHGVDFARFASASADDVPADLASIPHPRIGFFGALEDYIIDFKLLEQIARQLPDAQLVLIGDATCPMDDLLALDNVHWLGKRPYETIPSYGAGFDVALMPWLRNEWCLHHSPIKMKEYLALGLPVVSTDFPEARLLGDVIALAADSDEFVGLVKDAVNGGGVSTPERRRAKVADDSWESRAAMVVSLAENVGR